MGAWVTLSLIALVTAALLSYRHFKLKNNKCRHAVLLIPVISGDEDFEQRVKACYWEETFADPMCAKDIVLVIMQPSANAYAARRLEQEYQNVYSVHISALADFLKRNYKEYEN